MNKRTLTALKKSIVHWKNIAAGKETGYDRDSCPLCAEFWDSYCEDCPIYKKTGLKGCDSTPHDGLVGCLSFGGELTDDCALVWIKREINFLKSLLPKVKK